MTSRETSSALTTNHSDELQLTQARLANASRLMALLDGGKRVVPLEPRLKMKISILRSVIPTIDLIVLDMTDIERDRALELFDTLFRMRFAVVEDFTAQLVGDPQKDIYTIVFTCIALAARSFKTLTQVQGLSGTDQEILLKESASEMMFLCSVPCLDYENMVWDPYKAPMKKQTYKNSPRLPVAMFRCLSSEIYHQYFAMVSGLFPEVREDFIISILVAGITFFDPNRPGLCDKEIVSREQDIFYNILIKYCVHKFGVHGLKMKLQGLTMRERVDNRFLTHLRKMKSMFEQTVIMTDGCKILQAVIQPAIESSKHSSQS